MVKRRRCLGCGKDKNLKYLKNCCLCKNCLEKVRVVKNGFGKEILNYDDYVELLMLHC